MSIKVSVAKLALKVLPEKEEVVDPYPPKRDDESQAEYNLRVPLAFQETAPGPKYNYRGQLL